MTLEVHDTEIDISDVLLFFPYLHLHTLYILPCIFPSCVLAIPLATFPSAPALRMGGMFSFSFLPQSHNSGCLFTAYGRLMSFSFLTARDAMASVVGGSEVYHEIPLYVFTDCGRLDGTYAQTCVYSRRETRCKEGTLGRNDATADGREMYTDIPLRSCCRCSCG